MNATVLSHRVMQNHSIFMTESLANLSQEYYKCDFSKEEASAYINLINDLNIHREKILSWKCDLKSELQHANFIIGAASKILNRHLYFRVLLSTIEINNNLIINSLQ